MKCSGVTAALILPCHLLIIDELERKRKTEYKVKFNRHITMTNQMSSNSSEMSHLTTRGQDYLTVNMGPEDLMSNII